MNRRLIFSWRLDARGMDVVAMAIDGWHTDEEEKLIWWDGEKLGWNGGKGCIRN